MYMQHLFHGRIQIVSLYIICLDSDVPCRTMGSFMSTVLILQAFLVPCDKESVSHSLCLYIPTPRGTEQADDTCSGLPTPRGSPNPFHTHFWQPGGMQCVSQKLRHVFPSAADPGPWTWPGAGGALLTGCAMCLQSPSRCFCGEGGKREVFLFCQRVGEVLKL